MATYKATSWVTLSLWRHRLIILVFTLMWMIGQTNAIDSNQVKISENGIGFVLKGRPYMMSQSLILHQALDLRPLKRAIRNKKEIRKQVQIICDGFAMTPPTTLDFSGTQPKQDENRSGR